jgi:hypothetical protein
MLRATHDAEVGRLEERLIAKERECEHLREGKKYWRQRAELFIDRAAAKAGVTHEPVMRETPVPGLDPFSAHPFAGIGLSEFDSSKHS